MQVGRRRQTEDMLKNPVGGRGREQVFASGHVGDFLEGIIDHDGQVVGCADVLAGEHHIIDERRIYGVYTVAEVVESESLAEWGGGSCVEAPAMGESGSEFLSTLGWSESSAGPWVGRFGAIVRGGSDAGPFSLNLLAGAEAGVCEALLPDGFQGILVGCCAGTLVHNLLVPIKAEPTEVLFNGFFVFGTHSRVIDILVSKKELASRFLVGQIMGDGSRQNVPQVKISRRAGSEAGAGWHHSVLCSRGV